MPNKYIYAIAYGVAQSSKRNKNTAICEGNIGGRDARMLFELFKYITENPRSSEELLDKLKAIETKESKLIEHLVF